MNFNFMTFVDSPPSQNMLIDRKYFYYGEYSNKINTT